MKSFLLLAAALAVTCVGASPALAQPSSDQPHLSADLAVQWASLGTNAVGPYGFWMQGGNVQLHGRLADGLGLVADVAGLHTASAHDAGVGLDLLTLTAGPRYTWAPTGHHLSVFGQGLAGAAFGFDSLFPEASGSTPSARSLALELGGGLNLAVSRRLSLRAAEADWVRTSLPNSTTNVQNSLRLGAGLVLQVR